MRISEVYDWIVRSRNSKITRNREGTDHIARIDARYVQGPVADATSLVLQDENRPKCSSEDDSSL